MFFFSTLSIPPPEAKGVFFNMMIECTNKRSSPGSDEQSVMPSLGHTECQWDKEQKGSWEPGHPTAPFTSSSPFPWCTRDSWGHILAFPI